MLRDRVKWKRNGMQTCGHEHHSVERKMFAENQGLWETLEAALS